MKKTSNNASTIAISVMIGAAVGAVGMWQMPNLLNKKNIRQAKKAFKKEALGVIETAKEFMLSIPNMLK